MKKVIRTIFVLLLAGFITCYGQDWQKPQLHLCDFAAGQECYLFNVGANRFYTEGNAWGTQGSVGQEGLKCKFVQSGEAVKLTNFSITKNAWRTTFVTTNGALYVDGDNPAECWWQVVPSGEKTFRLMISSPNVVYNQANYPGGTMGLDLFEDEYRTNLAALLMDAEEPGAGIYQTEWAVATPADYAQYLTDRATYDAAMQLKALVDEARDKGMDVADEEAVYADTSSTLAQLQTAIGSVTRKLLEDELAEASAENPIDVTSKFVANADYANNDNAGWKGNVQPGIDANNNLQNAEFFNTNFDTYQDLINLPDGRYRLSLQGYYRAGLEGPALEARQNGTEDNVMYAQLYATTGGKTTTARLQSIFADAPTDALGVSGEIHMGEWWIPNNMSSAAVYFAAGYYSGNSLDVQVANGKLRIGLRKSTTLRRDWVMLDNWKLEYLGREE